MSFASCSSCYCLYSDHEIVTPEVIVFAAEPSQKGAQKEEKVDVLEYHNQPLHPNTNIHTVALTAPARAAAHRPIVEAQRHHR